jgi:type IV secretory pathway ATPase VirB11/archaellum biosynthesis ATPase
VVEKIGHADSLYHRLVLVVGPEGSGKTTALRDVAERIDAARINVSLELSRRLLDLTERQRRIRVPMLLGGVVAKTEGTVVLLDNVELLFDTALRQDPLRLLQRLSRRRTVVATWNGSMAGGHIVYAVPGHPEYRRYPVDGVLVAGAETVV